MGFNIPQVLSKATLQVSLNCLSFRLAFVVLSPKGVCCKVLKDGASGNLELCELKSILVPLLLIFSIRHEF